MKTSEVRKVVYEALKEVDRKDIETQLGANARLCKSEMCQLERQEVSA